jgi:hypothetical protein
VENLAFERVYTPKTLVFLWITSPQAALLIKNIRKKIVDNYIQTEKKWISFSKNIEKSVKKA